MRIRQLIIRIVTAAGLITSMGGFLYAWNTDDVFVGSVWMIMGVGFMTSCAVYSLAMDDIEASMKALSTNRHHTTLDLRDPVISRSYEADPRTHVSV